MHKIVLDRYAFTEDSYQYMEFLIDTKTNTRLNIHTNADTCMKVLTDKVTHCGVRGLVDLIHLSLWLFKELIKIWGDGVKSYCIGKLYHY